MSRQGGELADAAQKWFSENGRPWFYARQADDVKLADGKLRIGETEFSSKRLHDLFDEAARTAPCWSR